MNNFEKEIAAKIAKSSMSPIDRAAVLEKALIFSKAREFEYTSEVILYAIAAVVMSRMSK